MFFETYESEKTKLKDNRYVERGCHELSTSYSVIKRQKEYIINILSTEPDMWRVDDKDIRKQEKTGLIY